MDMPQFQIRGVTLRVLLVAILIAMLGMAPRPHALREALDHARQELNRNDLPAALNQIEMAVIQAPWRIDLTVLAARYALQSDLPLRAIQLLEGPHVASRLGPADLLMLGDAYQRSGDSLMAAAIWQRVAELAPSPEIYQRLADHHLAREDYPAAILDLRQLLQLQPADAGLNYHIGLLYAVVDPDSALGYLAQAAEMDPTLAPSAQELQRKIRTARLFDEPAYTFTATGRALAVYDEWDLAEAAFWKATQLRPDYAEAWAFLGEARQHSSRHSSMEYSGLAELQRALRLSPSSVTGNLLMGLYWTRQGDYRLASSYIQTTLITEPDNPLLHAELANVLALQGNLPAAQAAYQQAISLAPEDPMFYRLLVEFCLTHQIQIRETGLPAARSALILAPEDTRSLDSIAQIMLLLEDYYSAERFLFRALEYNPAYAPAHLHLGMVFVQRGDMERGRQEFELAENLGSGTWTATLAQRFITYYYP
jgi:tetratricopeptide (TPR) repeat protein